MGVSSNKLLQKYTSSMSHYVLTLLSAQSLSDSNFPEAASSAKKGAECEQEYARRAGIEGTLSYGIRTCGLRRSRYIGLARTHVQHVLTAAAMNLSRVARWLADEPRARTRHAPLLRLQQAA